MNGEHSCCGLLPDRIRRVEFGFMNIHVFRKMLMHEDFKVDSSPSSSINNPTAKYNFKKDSNPSPVACITSRPKIVIDRRKQTVGAFNCVRSELVQEKKSR